MELALADFPLLLTTTIAFIVAAVVPRLVPRWPLWAHAVWRTTMLGGLFVLVQQLLGSPFRPHFQSNWVGQRVWQQIIGAAWWLICAQGIIGLTRVIVVLENQPRETRMVSDLIAGTIYIATVLAIVDFVLEVPIGALLATSGIVAIVLGFALQSTLADVFSGIAVGIERPYRAGDLLTIEGGIEGLVTQVNWRSTHVATMQGNIAIVPNSIIAKARLVNHSLPTPVRGASITIDLDPRVAPERCIATLIAATHACLLPLAAPPPSVGRVGLRGDGAAYEISFSIASTSDLPAVRSELFRQVQGHLRHAGIPLAVVGLSAVPSLSIPTSLELLGESDLFGVISLAELTFLAERLTEVWLVPGDPLMRQGSPPDALFIIASGVLEVTVASPAGAIVVHRISPGESLGAIGLITNMPYAATATALTAVKAYSLNKSAIEAAIKARPQLAADLEQLAQRGRASFRTDAVGQVDDQLQAPEMLSARLRGFLHRLSLEAHAVT